MIFTSIITQNGFTVPDDIFKRNNLSSNIYHILGDSAIEKLYILVGERINNNIIGNNDIIRWLDHLDKTGKMNHPFADLLLICKDNEYNIKFYLPTM